MRDVHVVRRLLARCPSRGNWGKGAARVGCYLPEVVVDTVWQSALKAAKKTEAEVVRDFLGPWDDFEWGKINGKLSAIRWVLGDERDMLDT